MNKLFLLDGMALVYRAHFALIRSPITNSKGLNTSAAFGFTNTLLTILEKEAPTHIAVAFDTSAPTGRHVRFPAYKAQREDMPEEIATSIPIIKNICAAFNIPILVKDGFEADDIIGTLAHQAEQRGDTHTYMVTPDKDFAQLVAKNTTMFKPGRQGSDIERLGLAEILEKWQISDPKQVIDILGLWGDASDNIPGVPGIGEKTAKILVAKYGSIEGLLAHTDELKGKQKENVIAFREQALLSKELATIILDVKLDHKIDDLIIVPNNEKNLRDLFEDLEFRTLTKRLFGESNSSQSSTSTAPEKKEKTAPIFDSLKTITEVQHSYRLVQTDSDLAELLAELKSANPICLDVETTGLDRFQSQLLGIAFTTKPHTGWYLPWRDRLGHLPKNDETQEGDLFSNNATQESSLDAPSTVPSGLDVPSSVPSGLDVPSSARPAKNLSTPEKPSEEKTLPTWHARLLPILQSSALKIGHNLKFDLNILHRHHLPVAGPFFDTMLAHCLVSPEQKHSMDALAENLLGYSPVKLADLAEPIPQSESQNPNQEEDLFTLAENKAKKSSKKILLDMAAIPLDKLAEYAAEDTDVTFQLHQKLAPQLTEMGMENILRDIESPLTPVLVAMEAEGINVDLTILAEISKTLQTRIDQLQKDILTKAGTDFNLNSPKQLGEILFGQMHLLEKPKKTKTGQFKTDEQTLSALAPKHPIVENILNYRQASKLKSTYVDALPDHIQPSTGRVHTHLHQLLTGTGRMASSDPNLQNIPIRTPEGREIRKAFVPRSEKFTLLAADYSQVELRVMAALSGDQGMIAAFRDGLDIHQATAAKVHHVSLDEVTPDMRRVAKMVNFGIIYGISAFGLSQRLDIPRSDASEIIDTYFQQYPAIKEFMEATIASGKEKGYVETLSGRRRYFPDLQSGNGTVRANAERAAINSPIQGTAADMIKIAMIRIHEHLDGKKSKLLLQVHDELIFDLHESEHDLIPEIVSLMELALPLPGDLPILVETGFGKNWLEAH